MSLDAEAPKMVTFIKQISLRAWQMVLDIR